MILRLWDATFTGSDLARAVDFYEGVWDHVKRWDRSYAVVLHDPRGLMRELLARRAVLTNKEKRCLDSRGLVLYGDYFLLFVVPSWLYQGDLLAAHHCLNVAFDSLIKAVFLANDELIPQDFVGFVDWDRALLGVLLGT